MSVLIRGMEMPKSCDECPCFSEYDACDVTGSWKYADGFDKGKARLPDCPLVSVLPHGRLIDADALEKKIKRDGIRSDVFVKIVCNYFKDAPTIIPAKEEEG